MLTSPSDGPRLPSVSVSPSAEIVEGSSVTLTCSSDANPAANYTWYKKNGDPDLQPLSKDPQLVFSSIQSSDSGEYYCTAENQLGRRTSEYIYVNVTCEFYSWDNISVQSNVLEHHILSCNSLNSSLDFKCFMQFPDQIQIVVHTAVHNVKFQ